MFFESITDWRDIVYPLVFMATISYLAARLARYLNERYGTSLEEEKLAFVAAQLNCSAYRVFCVSGALWNIGREQIDDDFKEYLYYLQIPYYVRDFIANVMATLERPDADSEGKQKRWFFSNGEAEDVEQCDND